MAKIESSQAEGRLMGRKKQAILAICCLAIAGAVIFGVTQAGSEAPKSPETSQSVNPGTSAENGFDANSPSLGRHFNELNPTQQAEIKRLHDMSFDEFSQQPVATIMLYGDWIRQNWADEIARQKQNQINNNDPRQLPDVGPHSMNEAPQNFVSQYVDDAYIWAAMPGYMPDTIAASREDMKKFALFIADPIAEEYKNMITNADASDMQLVGVYPRTVTNSQGYIDRAGENIVEVAAKNDFVSPDGSTQSSFTFQPIAYKDINGNDTVQWRLLNSLLF